MRLRSATLAAPEQPGENHAARRLSLPREHGGTITLAGAALAGVLVAPAPLPALAASAAMAAGFFARGPLERMAVGVSLRAWDRPYLVALAAVAVAATWVVGRTGALTGVLTGGLAALLAGAAVVARRARAHRDQWFEVGAMGGMGATAGLAALAGGASARAALVLVMILSTHAAAAVPMVRRLVRGKKSTASAGTGEIWVAFALVVAVGVAVGLAWSPVASLALVPRAVRLAVNGRRGRGRLPASSVGIRESIDLIIAAAVAVLAIA